MNKIKTTLGVLATALMLSTSAHAVQKIITVTADIDESIDLLQADASALPTSIALDYTPASGLKSHSIDTKIFTNNETQPVIMRLAAEPKLTKTTDTNVQIPLSVTYNGVEVTTTPWDGTEAEVAPDLIFENSAVDGASITMPLVIGPVAGAGTSLTSGTYQGVVSLLVTQQP